ncbi:EAL and HDOD domain-containing protein [Solemya velesiana gill symbiont]|uniref:HDOD domain-containing protein n=1 Tax=Solemya velesiana gill symbiont TaxID=1918948 RepID=A0A1T2KX52_9GAMM|nr:HDOD domain-containing protein [Solemya velesiana gill symbiont]OOZ37402.1 hypothetical protein BOW51_02320 [Solemya velesiana gill symbiont]
MENFFIGRQAIFDRGMKVFAYELLYRDNQGRSVESLDGDQASSLVILNSFAEIGLERMVGSARAFINLTRNFFVEEPPIPFDKSRILLEILEDIPVDDSLIACCQTLSEQGFTLALDDFAFEEKWDPLLPIVDIIKVEVPQVDLATLEQRVHALRDHQLEFLAEKQASLRPLACCAHDGQAVRPHGYRGLTASAFSLPWRSAMETVSEYRQLHDMGFDYFQGYFFEKPTLVSGKRLGENRQVALSLLSKMNDPMATTKEIEQVITQDPGFSYKILRYLNSAAMGMPKKVDSIKQAVIYLGLRQIQSWANLIVLSGIDAGPKELLNLALTRAHMCSHLLGRADQQHLEGTAFTAGLLSTLDMLMGQELPQIITALPLSNEIRHALLSHEGPIGKAVACTLAYEHQAWPKVSFPGLDSQQISECYLEATEAAIKEFTALIEQD